MSNEISTPSPSSEMSFLDHVAELRRLFIRSFLALFIGFILSYIFYDKIVDFLSHPFQKISENNPDLFINSVVEAFFVKVKISFLFSLILTFPIHIYHILRFIFPALHPKEKKIVTLFLGASSSLIIFGVYYSYNTIIPISISFLTGTGFIPNDVGLLLSYEKNIMFIFQFLLAGLILFQLPLILNILLLLNILKVETLIQYHRYIAIIILIISGIITPPDPASLAMMALPLMVLFYMSIFVAKILKFGR